MTAAGNFTFNLPENLAQAVKESVQDWKLNDKVKLDLAKTLFIVSSKSGSTLEPNIFKQCFFERMKNKRSARPKRGSTLSRSPTLARRCRKSPRPAASAGIAKAAQARGDFQVLADRNGRALRVQLGADVIAGLATLRHATEEALS